MLPEHVGRLGSWDSRHYIVGAWPESTVADVATFGYLYTLCSSSGKSGRAG